MCKVSIGTGTSKNYRGAGEQLAASLHPYALGRWLLFVQSGYKIVTTLFFRLAEVVRVRVRELFGLPVRLPEPVTPRRRPPVVESSLHTIKQPALFSSYYSNLIAFFSVSSISEMGVELSLNPPTCPISAAGGVSKHKIINHCDQMLAYKIRSSNNSNYHVSTIYGLIQIGYTADLVITRVKGPPRPDHLTIQYASVPQDCVDPKAPFATGKPVGEITGETAIKLSAAE